MRRIGTAVVVVALLAAFGSAACGQPGGTTPRSGDPLEVHPTWDSCASAVPDPGQLMGAEAIDLPPLDDTLQPVSAVVCNTKSERRPDGGEDLVATEERTEEIAALLTALRLPDERLTDGACTADLPIVAWFALVDAQGRWARPGVPTDQCSKIRIEVRDAVAALSLTEVSKRTVREIESAEAHATGCTQQWANMVWVETQSRGDLATPVEPPPGAAEVRLCVYRVPESEQRSGKPAGEFEHGVVLPTKRWNSIVEKVRAAGPARACATPAGRFALLRRTDNAAGEIYVELDGCQRIMVSPPQGPPGLAQADAALIQLLTGR